MPPATTNRLWSRQTWLFLAFVIALSFSTYFFRYWRPAAVFWDENYHIASAQKYLHGAFFMEQHPPLGKLLVAAGEKVFHPNARTDQFLDTDYGREFKGVSFVGYRFFSALLGWWTAPLLFMIFLVLLRDPLQATLLSFLYVFDNALIVHLRGAMLEGPLVFFSALTVLVFLLLWMRAKPGYLGTQGTREDRGGQIGKIRQIGQIVPGQFALLSLLFGASFALTVTTKVVGLVFVLLVPVLCLRLLPRWRSIARFLALFTIGFLPLYVAIWQTHFTLASQVRPALPDAGYYQASPAYKQLLDEGRTGSLLGFSAMIRDSWKFVGHYNGGAPRLDLCKPDENGSPFYFWPLGARAINYRWETPDGKLYRYLYLQSNPVVWFASLAGLVLAVALAVASFLLPLRTPLKNRPLLLVFLGLYGAYMAAIGRIDRVLYLYHYFIPLVLSFIILALALAEIRRIGKWNVTHEGRTAGMLVLAACVFLGFQFYRPLTYYEPMSDAAFQRRAIVPLWELHCVKCPKVSGLVVPRAK